jgi:hypothetical protein
MNIKLTSDVQRFAVFSHMRLGKRGWLQPNGV